MKSISNVIADYILSHKKTSVIESEQVKHHLQSLYPAQEQGEICKKYYRDKLAFTIKIWLYLTLASVFLFAAGKEEGVIKEGNYLQRAGPKEEDTNVELIVNTGEEKIEVSFDVKKKKYKPKEIEQYCKKFEKEYESLILGENENLDSVRQNLVFQSSYEDYPMEFVWRTSNYSILSESGEINNAGLTRAELVEVEVEMIYEETGYLLGFFVNVLPLKLSKEESLAKVVREELMSADEKQQYEEYYHLPESVLGKKVSYSQKESNSLALYLCIPLFLCVVLFFVKDNDLKKEVEKKRARLVMKYPEFVSKYQLLYEAGMTERGIFMKLKDDECLGEDLQKELSLVIRDLNNGLSAKEVLDKFGRRCASPQYIKFCSLLIQNIKIGNDDFSARLSEEVKEAFLLRKTLAIRLGEEAGTKLLGPMVFMLAIVLAVLMIPAFLSFQL